MKDKKMKNKKTSIFENGLLWFGAAVSIAEIMTGTYISSLGFGRGVCAVIIGHVIGCMLLFLAGFIGAKTGKSAMETVKISFGHYGSMFFALLNIVQLFGWTALMIYDGALATNTIWPIGNWVWCLIIGCLILIWIIVGIKNLGKMNIVAMIGLFALTVVLSFIIFGRMQTIASTVSIPLNQGITFGAAVELSIAMPLSWLPLISDYTREAKYPVKSTAVSAIVYGVVSCWMYVIGMGAAIFTGESDIANIMVKAGLGIAGLLILVFSTVTTTFLDAWSAGISGETVFKKWSGKWMAIGVTIIGICCAIFFPITNITTFLYFIGSVFAPMIAIQIIDYFVLKQDFSEKPVDIRNLIIWLLGFFLYRASMKIDFFVGNTVPAMAILMLLCILIKMGEVFVLRLNKKKVCAMLDSNDEFEH